MYPAFLQLVLIGHYSSETIFYRVWRLKKKVLNQLKDYLYC
jgi:hypothetical protein